MAHSLSWNGGQDQQDIIHMVVQALVEGKLVILPTETAYHVVCSALNEDALQAFHGIYQGASDKGAADKHSPLGPPSLLLRAAEESFDYSPGMSRVARRAVYRGWPGPLVLDLPISSPSESDVSLAQQLPALANQLLIQNDFLSQRVVPHPIVTEAMRLTPGPLIAAPCLDANGDSVSEPEALPALPCALVVNDGETHFGGLATRVRTDGNACELLTPGALDQARIDRLFHLVILIVCTGNTCRSPMAEVIFRHQLQKKFPKLSENAERFFHVGSAGLSAFPGGQASPQAQVVVRNRGLDLSRHQSRCVTEQSLRQADLILTMTGSHRHAIVSQFPDLEDKVSLFSAGQGDISDPFGGSEGVYSECADQIEHFALHWVEQIDENWFPSWKSAG